jgi:hypothetical protein
MSELGGNDILAREGGICADCPNPELGKLAAGQVCRGLIPININEAPSNVCGRGDESKSLREGPRSSSSNFEDILRRF